MKFGTFLLRFDGIRETEINDLQLVVTSGQVYHPKRQKYLYLVDSEIVDDRFFWLSSEYDDAARFSNFVINQETGEKEENPRSKNQVEPRQQFFACFDAKYHYLYLNDMNRRNFLQEYLSHMTQHEFSINNVYTSVDDFCNHIKVIRSLNFVQTDNLFARNNKIFTQVPNMLGLDVPEKIQMKIALGDIPIHRGRSVLDRLHRDLDAFANVIIVGCDDSGVEQTYDFSSVIRHIVISPQKDENEHYNPQVIKELLLAELRKQYV